MSANTAGSFCAAMIARPTRTVRAATVGDARRICFRVLGACALLFDVLLLGVFRSDDTSNPNPAEPSTIFDSSADGLLLGTTLALLTAQLVLFGSSSWNLRCYVERMLAFSLALAALVTPIIAPSLLYLLRTVPVGCTAALAFSIVRQREGVWVSVKSTISAPG